MCFYNPAARTTFGAPCVFTTQRLGLPLAPLVFLQPSGHRCRRCLAELSSWRPAHSDCRFRPGCRASFRRGSTNKQRRRDAMFCNPTILTLSAEIHNSDDDKQRGPSENHKNRKYKFSSVPAKNQNNRAVTRVTDTANHPGVFLMTGCKLHIRTVLKWEIQRI